MATRKKIVSRRSFFLKLSIALIPLLGPQATLMAAELVSGVVLPRHQVELSFSGSGRIDKLQSIGATVMQGDVIGRLDDDDAKASLKLAEIAVNIANLALKKAEHDRDKKSRLSGEDIISSIAITEAEFTVSSANEELHLSQAKLASAMAELESGKLIAPFTGVIIDLYASESEYANTGSPVTSFADLSKLSLTVDVPYSLSISLKKGLTSTIEYNGVVMGKVSVQTLLPIIDPASGLRRIIWQVDESYVDLLAGRYVNITPWQSE